MRLDNFAPAAPHLSPAHKDELDMRLVLALCNDGLPLSLFEKRGVPEADDRAAHADAARTVRSSRLVAALHAGYTIPARATLAWIATVQLVPRIKKDIVSIIELRTFQKTSGQASAHMCPRLSS